MFLLRVGRQRRWDRSRDPMNPEDRAEAALDLALDEGEAGLSVYRVEGEDDRRDVALRFALTLRGQPQHLDYVVFPADLATALGLKIEHVPASNLEPTLNDRHYEILGLTPEIALRLAGAILGDAGRHVGRVRERDLEPLGRELCRRHPEVLNYLVGSWPERLNPRPSGSTPGG